MNLQPVYTISQICAAHGITEAVLSPGSRCAPVTLSFTRNNAINTKTISDERSAAFIALGIAQITKKATVLVCTSGSAAYNYAPAVAEAFFQQVPLLVLTADRPPEWIDQWDGQTIRQKNIYGEHVKANYNFPVDLAHPDAAWHAERIINEAIITAHHPPYGPVHVNIPLREPFYPTEADAVDFSKQPKVFKRTSPTLNLSDDTKINLLQQWTESRKKLIVCGQHGYDKNLQLAIDKIIKKQRIPVCADVISNMHPANDIISHSDLFLALDQPDVIDSLKPDLLITIGKSLISKNLKLFLRKLPDLKHWHITTDESFADTFQSLTKIINMEPSAFFDTMDTDEIENKFDSQKQENFYQLWQIEDRKAKRVMEEYFPAKTLGELEVLKSFIQKIRQSTNLHLANSLTVRYANYIGLAPHHEQVEVFCNRGTSGIDGCTSTAVGSSLVSNKQTILITGDLAFFYDRNAFWHNYKLHNFKVLLLNNHGGSIFRMIKGPGNQPELEEYFETRQKLSAKDLCQEFNLNYMLGTTKARLDNQIKEFLEEPGPTVWEVETDSKQNMQLLKDFKNSFTQSK